MQIYLVKTRLVNSYVVTYPDRILVIDVAVGCHKHVAAFITGKLSRDLSDIKFIICTHDDPDHLGGVRDLARISGAAIGLPWASKSLRRKIMNDPNAFYFRFFSSFREAFRSRSWAMYANADRSRRFKSEVESLTGQKIPNTIRTKQPPNKTRIKDGQALRGFEDWQLIHTPGHSWDSCCYYHRESESLISGDTLLGSRRQGKLVAPAILANPRHLRKSYARLSELPISSVYPGHGSIIEGKRLIHRPL